LNDENFFASQVARGCESSSSSVNKHVSAVRGLASRITYCFNGSTMLVDSPRQLCAHTNKSLYGIKIECNSELVYDDDGGAQVESIRSTQDENQISNQHPLCHERRGEEQQHPQLNGCDENFFP
jgi:hypothetical protein